MKLVSKFHDYYDGATKSFPDKNPLYIRKTINNAECDIKYTSRTNNFNNMCHNPLTDDISEQHMFVRRYLFGDGKVDVCYDGLVGFCGKIYPYFQVDIQEHDKNYLISETKHEYIYDDHQLHGMFIKHSNKKKLWHLNKVKSNMIHEYFEFLRNHEWLKSLFLEFKTPIFHLESRQHLTINPILREYDFQKIVDPFTTAQELDMFLGNELANESNLPIDITDDKVIKQAKGFGHKYAFKKMPKKKK